jgi:hypothetical protein
MSRYFHVRINSKKQPHGDFTKFLAEITSSREGQWDKDTNGFIKTGDYLGFITGPKGDEVVHIFLVKSEHNSSERPEHWAKGKPHTDGNGKCPVDGRGVIVLTDKHRLPKTIEWSDLRTQTGLGGTSTTWMPRGTERVKSKQHLLPFAHLLRDNE